MGLFLTFGRLRMRCPFCGGSGTLGGSREEGMWLECDHCGTVRGVGRFALGLTRQETQKEHLGDQSDFLDDDQSDDLDG
jgi:hypothetical protein